MGAIGHRGLECYIIIKNTLPPNPFKTIHRLVTKVNEYAERPPAAPHTHLTFAYSVLILSPKRFVIMKKWLFVMLCLSLSMMACEKEEATPECKLEIGDQYRVFEFYHDTTDDTFLAWTSDTTVIKQVEAQLALPLEQRSQHINGKILRLPENCSLNQEWSWYFAPDEWIMADASIEVCDGNPQYVEENLAEYVDNVGQYCPWGSVVFAEVTGQ